MSEIQVHWHCLAAPKCAGEHLTRHERLSQSLHSSVGRYQSVPTTNTRGAMHIVVILIVLYQVHGHVTWGNGASNGRAQSHRPLAPSVQACEVPDAPYSWRFARLYGEMRESAFQDIYNYLMSVEGKLILRRQAVGIKYCGDSFTHRVLGAPIPQRVARRLEHAGTQANPSRLVSRLALRDDIT